MNDLIKDRTTSIPSNNVNTDSNLRGLQVTEKVFGVHGKYSVYGLSDCCNHTEYTRLVNAPCTLRCTGVNNFTPIIEDPQLNISNPTSAGVNSRSIARNSFNRKCNEQYITYTALPSQHNNYEDKETRKINDYSNIIGTTSLSYQKFN